MGEEKTKKVILMGLEDNIKSYLALKWVLNFYGPKPEHKIIIVHVKPEQQGSAGEEVHTSTTVDTIKKTLELICMLMSVNDIPPLEVLEGDPTTVLVETARKYQAHHLIVGGTNSLIVGSGPLKGASLYDICPCRLSVRSPL